MPMSTWLFYVCALLCGYLLGSIPFGYLVGKSQGIDLTKEGSGSTGTTNVLRLIGKQEAIFVLLADFMKGLLAPVVFLLLFVLFGQAASFLSLLQVKFSLPLLQVFACIGSLIGHVKSVWIGFKGGKAVATGVGTLFALDPLVGLITALIWGLTVYYSKYSSLGACLAVPISPLLMFSLHYLLPIWQNKPVDLEKTLIFTVYCLIGAMYILYKHRANIQRLKSGTEPKIGQKV